ncbi:MULTISPECIES: polysaccharide biosynthesis tyrosine autokinase [unclassified Psychrobacter]|uniref:polysaccharide biosynthesis tyrosine autokinase n=1 Tax=unclassified Psychrobacter TaxID=196806 RepID=UPI00071E9136|nr:MULTISPECIES: polysaccharide biosynthesis tyrosine autokinase [unclassified Psychrobacter]OLF36407.1 lipopolysaccharide biosynthesis protein [Psychrobacter sp. Cmf 22.2]
MNTDSQKLSTSGSDRDNKEIDLSSLLGSLLRGWKTLLFFTLLGLIAGILYTRYVNPTFQSDALVQIDANPQGVSALGENISNLVGSGISQSQEEAQLIKSRMVLKPVVDSLHLQIRLKNPEINAIDRIVEDRINTPVHSEEGVSLQTESGEVTVSQFDVSEEYLDQGFTLSRSDTGFVLSSGVDTFKGQLNQPHQFKGTKGPIEITVEDLPSNGQPIGITKQSLKITTDAINGNLTVEETGNMTGLIQLSLTGPNQQQTTLILNEIVMSYVNQNKARSSEETTKTLDFMETQIPVLKQKLEESEAAFNEFRKRYGTIDVAQEAQLLLAEESRIDGQLSDLKLQQAELSTYYTDEHPLVVQINDQLRVLNNRKQEINNTVAGLPEIQREFLKLSEDVDINREIYLTMLTNYEQLKIVKAGQIGYARIVDLPVSTYNAIAPKDKLVILLATVLGAILGALIVLLRSAMRNVVRDPEMVESNTGVPVIATVPRSKALNRLGKNKRVTNRLLSYSDHNSATYEAIKSLRTYLMFGMPSIAKSNQRSRVIVVTGESPNVGKSFIVANLAEVFAQLNKKVLVIDADMRLGSLHNVFNMEQDTGLTDFFTEEQSTAVSITHPTNIDNLDFIPRGHNARNPSSMLASEKFGGLMNELAAHYDYIIIDTPPVLAATDAVILSKYADQVVMVTRHNDSLEGQLNYAVKQMNKANIEVDGIIINDLQQGILSKNSYHYTYTYGNAQ